MDFLETFLRDNLIFHYQPIFDKNKNIFCYEILSRIKYNNLIYYPLSFLDFLKNEKYQTLLKILIEKNLKFIKDNSLKCKFNINVNFFDLENDDIIDTIIETKEYFNVEFLENSFYYNYIDKLCFLKQTGITIFLDDFGSDKSITNYFDDIFFENKNIFDYIKLDKILVNRVLKEEKEKEKLKKINPTIISITASYGKTSIKNFVYQLLKDDFNAYKTPRSVNTIKGIVLDINTKLPDDSEIYITEAGARERGDIKEIVKFLENDYSILGKIGPQHIEYFKSLENIKKTKLEIFESPKLKKGFSYEEVDKDKVIVVKDKIKNIKSTLDGIEWDVEIDGKIHHFKAPILGEFNAINVTLAIFQALEFIKDIEKIKSKVLKLESVPHRLQKVEVGGKIIIDDSFNGNIEGMIKSFDLVKDFKGRKIIVTPGIVEGTKEMNEKIAKKINQVFDIAIITGETNRKVLCSNITIEKIVLKDKKNLEKVLAEITKSGDLILFSNDFPEYL
jgi:UDP-N-acetylmuramoyl-tripeptide--D-alanyl-D-alanine ligase